MKKISIRLENCDHYLAQLLKGFNKEEYIWFLKFDDVHKFKGGFLFEEEIYTNKRFWSILMNNTDYFIVHLQLVLYENEIEKEKNISLLELNIEDCEFVEAYFNDERVEEILCKNIEELTKGLH